MHIGQELRSYGYLNSKYCAPRVGIDICGYLNSEGSAFWFNDYTSEYLSMKYCPDAGMNIYDILYCNLSVSATY